MELTWNYNNEFHHWPDSHPPVKWWLASKDQPESRTEVAINKK
jgi:hypothetical protein